MLLRPDDVKCTVTQDGKEILSIKNVNNVTVRRGLQAVTRRFVGDDQTRTHGANGPATIRVGFDPDRPDLWSLLEAQALANEPNATSTPLVVSFTMSFDMGSEGRVRMAYSPCIASDDEVSTDGNATSTVKGALMFTCDKPRRI